MFYYSTMETNMADSASVLDFLGNEKWPNELRTLVSQHLSAKDLLVCRLISQNWRDCTENEFYCKILERPYLSDYYTNSKGRDYYQLFADGGAHLIRSSYELQCNKSNEKELRYMHFLKKGRIDDDLGFYYVEEEKRLFGEQNLIELKSFLSGAALRFDCPYLAVPRRYLGSERHFYVVFDDGFEEFERYIESIPVEEYTEKLVTKLVTQLIHAVKYLNDRNFCLLTRHGGISLGIKRTLYGDIQLKLINYTYHLFVPPLVTTAHFLSPERVALEPVLPTSDLFSLGSLTLYLLTGEPLYNVQPMRLLHLLGGFQSYESQDPNDELSDQATDFVVRLLKLDPNSRMTLEEALQHPWLTDPEPSCTPLHTAYKNFTTESTLQH